MSRTARRLIGTAAALAVVAAACGNDDDSAATAPPNDQDEAEPAPDPADGDDAAGEAFSAVPADGWTVVDLGGGIKPEVALDGDDTPAVAWLEEDFDGHVSFASLADDWSPQIVNEGYFYGPIDLEFDPEGRPNLVWHDHEGQTFDPNLGNLAFGRLDDGTWTIEAAEDDGHDGWDSALAVGDDGSVFAVGIDPAREGFDRTDGVEFYERSDDGTWAVEAIGSGPVDYEYNVGIAISPDGQPAVSWYDTQAPEGQLLFAERIDGEWQIETVTDDGDVGQYSSLAFDSQGRPNLSFFEVDAADPSSGRVHYAVRDGGEWTIEEVGTLDDFEPGFTGARRNSALALGPDDQVLVAFSDKSTVQLATREGDGTWTSEEVLSPGAHDLSQQVSLQVDEAGTPHLATYEVTGPGQLGVVGVSAYLTPG